jgi:hypothetical protein
MINMAVSSTFKIFSILKSRAIVRKYDCLIMRGIHLSSSSHSEEELFFSHFSAGLFMVAWYDQIFFREIPNSLSYIPANK